MKYRTTITGCGPEAFAFLSKELDLNFVIIFNEDAPEELAELSILHTQERVLAEQKWSRRSQRSATAHWHLAALQKRTVPAASCWTDRSSPKRQFR